MWIWRSCFSNAPTQQSNPPTSTHQIAISTTATPWVKGPKNCLDLWQTSKSSIFYTTSCSDSKPCKMRLGLRRPTTTRKTFYRSARISSKSWNSRKLLTLKRCLRLTRELSPSPTTPKFTSKILEPEWRCRERMQENWPCISWPKGSLASVKLAIQTWSWATKRPNSSTSSAKSRRVRTNTHLVEQSNRLCHSHLQDSLQGDLLRKIKISNYFTAILPRNREIPRPTNLWRYLKLKVIRFDRVVLNSVAKLSPRRVPLPTSRISIRSHR